MQCELASSPRRPLPPASHRLPLSIAILLFLCLSLFLSLAVRLSDMHDTGTPKQGRNAHIIKGATMSNFMAGPRGVLDVMQIIRGSALGLVGYH